MPTKLKPQSGSSSKANRNAPGMKPRNSSGPSRPSTGFEPSKTRDEARGNHATAAEPSNYIGDLEKILDQEGVAKGDPAEKAHQERLTQNDSIDQDSESGSGPVNDFYNSKFGVGENNSNLAEGNDQPSGPIRTSGKFVPTLGKPSKSESSEPAPYKILGGDPGREKESLGSLINQDRADRESRLNLAKKSAQEKKVRKFNLVGKGKKRLKAALLGVLITAVISVPVGIILAIPHAIQNWIENRAGELGERAMDKMGQQLLMSFLRDRVAIESCKGYYSSSTNAVSAVASATGTSPCRARMGERQGRVKQLFDDWQSANMEDILAKNGIEVSYNANPGDGGDINKPYSISVADGKPDLRLSDDIYDLDWDIGDSLGRRQASKRIRSAIKPAMREETRMFQFLKRRNMKAGFLRNLGLPGRFWGPDSLAKKLDDRDIRIKNRHTKWRHYLTKHVIELGNGRLGTILEVILDGDASKIKPSELIKQNKILRLAAEKLGDEAVEKIIDKYSKKSASEVATQIVADLLQKLFKEAGEFAGELLVKGIPIVGQILLAFAILDLMDLATDGSLQKWISTTNAAQYMEISNLLATETSEELRFWVDAPSAVDMRRSMIDGLSSSRMFVNTVGYKSVSGKKAPGYGCKPKVDTSTLFSAVGGIFNGENPESLERTGMADDQDVCTNNRVDYDPLSPLNGVFGFVQGNPTGVDLTNYTDKCILEVVGNPFGGSVPANPITSSGICPTAQEVFHKSKDAVSYISGKLLDPISDWISNISFVKSMTDNFMTWFNNAITIFLTGSSLAGAELLTGGYGTDTKSGARIFDAVSGGNQVTSNAFAKGAGDGGGLGGTTVTPTQAAEINKSIASERKEELANASIYDRFFDISKPDTLASISMAATVTDGGVDSLINPMKNIATIFGSGRSSAYAAAETRNCSFENSEGQAVTELGVICYTHPDELLDALTEEEIEQYGDPEFCKTYNAEHDAALKAKEEIGGGDEKAVQDPDGSATNTEPNYCELVCTTTDTMGTLFRKDDEICGFKDQPAAAGGGATTTEDYNTTDVPCAAGTTDVGDAKAYKDEKPYDIKLCSIPGFVSTGTEDVDSGINLVRVNSTISEDTLKMFNDMVASGMNTPTAVSSFRSMEFQTSQYGDGSSGEVAKPGTSNHQMGYAIDFALGGCNPGGKDRVGASRDNCQTNSPQTSPPCKDTNGTEVAPMKNTGTVQYDYLTANASNYKFNQLCFEAWHWEHEPAPVKRTTGGGASGGGSGECAAGMTKVEDTQTYVKGVPTDSTICSYDKFPSTGSEDGGVARFSADVSAKVKEMVDAAAAGGVQLQASSTFRSNAKQEQIYNCFANNVCEPGESYPDAAEPGFSNHQSGSALDFSNGSASWNWMKSNADGYGFKWFGGGDPVHWSTTGG